MAYNTITVPRGGEYSLVLSDGTRVWLNAETELTYPTVFGKGERKLMLKGEACFEVVTDTARPFIVESFYNRVEVLGTRFNVSAYTGKSAVKTTLLRGKVKVSNRKGQLVLSPGEQAVCLEEEIEKCEVDARAVAAWVDGTFEFENMSLGEITDQLGRWYDVDFVFADQQLKAITFTGAATRYRELDFVLRMLEELARVRFQLEIKRSGFRKFESTKLQNYEKKKKKSIRHTTDCQVVLFFRICIELAYSGNRMGSGESDRRAAE